MSVTSVPRSRLQVAQPVNEEEQPPRQSQRSHEDDGLNYPPLTEEEINEAYAVDPNIWEERMGGDDWESDMVNSMPTAMRRD